MFGSLISLKELRKFQGLNKLIIWDIDLKQLMEPRVAAGNKQECRKMGGYLFYIEKTSGSKPMVYLMCHTEGGFAETIAKIDEVPEALIQEAISEKKGKEFFGMYPINKKIEEWLKKELGITD